MFVVGITGGIGCGKSTVASFCRQAGLPVIDADHLSHEVTATGGAAIPDLVDLFGRAALNKDGSLNRKAMAERVFQDRRLLDALSETVHRHVIAAIQAALEAHEAAGSRGVVLDVPIPVEEGFIDLCDQVWVVWASDENRLARLRARGMDPAEAKRRMAMQMGREAYVRLADHVLENDGSLEALKQATNRLLQEELKERGVKLKPLDLDVEAK